MKKSVALILTALILAALPAPASAPLENKMRAVLQSYLTERGKIERITIASASVRLGGNGQILSTAVGTTPSNLFQIGSNTKAFTAVATLQLEAAGRLSIDEPIGRWLPQYPAWKNLTIRHLLDMTSGIPTYDNEPAFQKTYAADCTHDFSKAELVSFVYPKNGKAQFLPGWNYSNTGYILTEMIIERITGKAFAEVLRENILAPMHLGDTYYDPNSLPPAENRRLVPGYFFSDDSDNAGFKPIYDKDVSGCSLSWTQAAGGIVATPSAVVRWAQILYRGAGLPAKQRDELTRLVSTKTGKPIQAATPAEPRAFGLGVSQLYKPPFGRFWFYEGETLGYRVVHVWLPQSGTILAVALNSQPRAKDDAIGELAARLMKTLPPAYMK